MSENIPQGLTALEYSRHIIEFELCWPAKSNVEMIADCISSISKGKKLPLEKAYKYLARAISLAKEQSITVDRLFFLNGDYMNVRPNKKLSGPYVDYKRIDRTGLDEHQASPEYQQTIAEFRAKLKEIAQGSQMK